MENYPRFFSISLSSRYTVFLFRRKMKWKCFYIMKNNTSPFLLRGVATGNGWKNWWIKNGVYLWWFFFISRLKFYVHFIYFLYHEPEPPWKMIRIEWENGRKENSIKKHSKTQMCHISQTTGIKVCIRLYYANKEKERKKKVFSCEKMRTKNFYSNE